MRLFFSTIFLICLSQSGIAQIDYMDPTNIPDELKNPLELPQGENKSDPYQSTQNHSLTNPQYKNGFYKPSEFLKKEKSFSMSTDNGLKERTIEYQPKYLEQFQDSGGKGSQTTQYFGRYTSTGKFVEIYCRDHEFVDGDRVQVLINGKVVSRSITLSGSFRPVLVTLKKGFNRIEIKALNEGTSSPNTAEFIVYDENGSVITQDRWNLATGVKASFLIQKP